MMPTFEVSDLIDTLVDRVMGSMEFAIPTNEIRIEPRCRICRDETVRTHVNESLVWRGTTIFPGGNKTHVITLADILRDLKPLNEGRDAADRITYMSRPGVSGDSRSWEDLSYGTCQQVPRGASGAGGAHGR